MPLLCRVLDVSRSGYYAWLRHPLSHRAQEEGRLEAEIKAAHERTRQTCGPDRLQKDLAAHGVDVGICRIRRIRKKLGIRCKQVKRFKRTTDSTHTLPVAPNLLEQQFEASSPHRLWVSDITYIPLPMKAGSIVRPIRTFSMARLSDMHGDRGSRHDW
jgi:putative transposase